MNCKFVDASLTELVDVAVAAVESVAYVVMVLVKKKRLDSCCCYYSSID